MFLVTRHLQHNDVSGVYRVTVSIYLLLLISGRLSALHILAGRFRKETKTAVRGMQECTAAGW